MDSAALNLVLTLIFTACSFGAFLIFVSQYRRGRRQIAYYLQATAARDRRQVRAPRTRSYARTGR